MSEQIFDGSFFQAFRLDGGIVEIRIDRKNEAVNKLDAHTTDELTVLLDQLATDAAMKGVLLTSGKDAFLMGADVNVLASMLDQPEDRLAAFSRDSGGVLTRLEDLPVPMVAAVNGYALGGGLEMALCSDYRVLATNGQVGLPEVSLGILPGFGGTVRLSRLTDTVTALEWLIGARPQKADAALKAGVVDALASPELLRDAALTWLNRAINGELDWKSRRERRRGPCALDESALAAARAGAQQQARNYPAGLVVVDLIETCAPLSRDAALPAESEAFARLAKTPTAKAMVGVFLAGQQLKKKSKQLAVQGRRVQRAAVLGAGIMGGGIAYTTAVNGMSVLLKDIAQSALDLGTGEARKLLRRQIDGGRMKPEKAEAILSSIHPTLSFKDFDRVDVVVEAVVENLSVKRQLLTEVESLVKPGTVIASNTSSLSIAEIAAALKRPEDVVGMHFFNPAHVMPLVEVVRGPKTSDVAVATIVSYAVAMGKTPLVVRDCAGFLINRLLGAYFTAFLQLVRDGADFVELDRVLESWGWPMGPAYLLDVAGLDTLDKALVILGKAYPEVMATPYSTAINLLAAQRRYGQKTGAGFYRYEPDAKGKPKRSRDAAAYELLEQIQPDGTRKFSDEEILDRMMLPMVIEAGRCLDEQIADGAVDIDAGMRLGTGFPAHHGGPLWYADTIGLCDILRRCERYQSLGGLYVAGAGLRRLASENRSFYGSAAARDGTTSGGGETK